MKNNNKKKGELVIFRILSLKQFYILVWEMMKIQKKKSFKLLAIEVSICFHDIEPHGMWMTNFLGCVYFEWIRYTHTAIPFCITFKTIQPNLLFAWVCYNVTNCYILYGFTFYRRKSERIAFFFQSSFEMKWNKKQKISTVDQFSNEISRDYCAKYHIIEEI